jgi:polysaccharide chain length determinant protein (PEP-CTERM system associated)
MMQNTPEVIKPEYILEIFLRRRWYLIVPFCLSMMVGIYLALILPKVYGAKTLILVQAQRVPTDYVQPVVSADIDARISTISQQILSRTNLEKIIAEFNLFSGPEYNKMYPEDKIENLSKRISVDVIRNKETNAEADAFSISFRGENPRTVMRIANTLATYFIDENLRVREAQAVGTSDFLDEELVVMRQRLEALEETLKKYRETYMGELPEQLETNLRILDRLQEQLSIKQENLRDAKNRLSAFEKQISEERKIQYNDLGEPSGGYASNPLIQLEQLKKELEDLKISYTNRHPDIIRAKRKIAELESRIEKESGEPESSRQTGGSSNRSALLDGKYKALQVRQQEEMRREILALEAEIPQLLNQINAYQKRVENTPKREQELLSLRRDYQNIKDSYDSLLQRKLQAQLAVNMEKKQKGEQFRILDPARVPNKPLEPNMKKLFLFSLVSGLGIGCGIIFFLEYLDTSFRKPQEIESFLGIPILATVPAICHSKDRMRQRINMVFSIFSILISFALFAAFAVIIVVGAEETVAFVKTFMNI